MPGATGPRPIPKVPPSQELRKLEVREARGADGGGGPSSYGREEQQQCVEVGATCPFVSLPQELRPSWLTGGLVPSARE